MGVYGGGGQGMGGIRGGGLEGRGARRGRKQEDRAAEKIEQQKRGKKWERVCTVQPEEKVVNRQGEKTGR